MSYALKQDAEEQVTINTHYFKIVIYRLPIWFCFRACKKLHVVHPQVDNSIVFVC